MIDRQWPDEDIAVETTEVHGLAVTRISGEIDLTGVDRVRAELTAQVDRRPAALVADMSEVTVLGSLGIAALVEAHQHAVAAGVEFTVVAGHRAVVRPLEITEVDRLLTVLPTLDEVVATTRSN